MKSEFIRIQNYRFPSRPYDDACRGHEREWEELLGHSDGPEDDAEYPGGIGSRIYGLIRQGEFVVANGDWWCNKTGHVHST